MILRRLDQREGVLGEARAAEARAGMQEFGADAVVEADAAGDFLDIGADLLAQIGDLVDEGDLGREKRVRGIFDQLGGPAIREQQRRFVELSGRYTSDITSRARSSVAPTTMRSGSLKSLMAAPSRRNSGFETTENSAAGFCCRISR